MANEEDQGREPTFAQRYGYMSFDTTVQVETLNERTRMDLWNLAVYPLLLRYPSQSLVNAQNVWIRHFVQERTRYKEAAYANMLHDVVINGVWYEVYSLIEFLVHQVSDFRRPEFAQPFNDVLKLNRAGYRIIDADVVPITSPEEVSAIELATQSPLAEASGHLKRALALFADRENPNFPKVIAEAMAGTEAAAQVLASKPGATLHDALTAIGKRQDLPLHPALIDGWKRLYGYAGDGGGIRHALKEGSVVPDQDLAQYFIITCSALINLFTAMSAHE